MFARNGDKQKKWSKEKSSTTSVRYNTSIASTKKSEKTEIQAVKIASQAMASHLEISGKA